MDGPDWEKPRGGPVREGAGFILRNGIPIVLTIAVTSLAANFFLRMRGGEGAGPSGSSVFAEPERDEAPSGDSEPSGSRAISSLDFAPKMGEPQEAAPAPEKEEPP